LSDLRLAVPHLKPRSNDEHVLHCCLTHTLRLAHRPWAAPDTRVILISNDRALCIKAMFNGVPAVSCEQLPTKISDCAALFLAAGELTPVEQPTAEEGVRLAVVNGVHDETRSATYSEVADRAMASISVVAGAEGISSTTRTTATTSTTSPLPQPKRKLCLCSKLGVLHYAHDDDEEPQPFNYRKKRNKTQHIIGKGNYHWFRHLGKQRIDLNRP